MSDKINQNNGWKKSQNCPRRANILVQSEPLDFFVEDLEPHYSSSVDFFNETVVK